MSRQFWAETVAWLTADGTAHANTTDETALAALTIPANYLSDGRLLRIRAFGKISTTGTPTYTWALRWGSASAGTLLATSEAITMGSGVTNVNWSIEAYLQVRTNGASGSVIVMGDLRVHTAATTVVTNVFGVSGYDAPAAVSSLNLTADTALTLSGDWSAASASNTATALIYSIESLN